MLLTVGAELAELEGLDLLEVVREVSWLLEAVGMLLLEVVGAGVPELEDLDMCVPEDDSAELLGDVRLELRVLVLDSDLLGVVGAGPRLESEDAALEAVGEELWSLEAVD